jgi:RNA polymerase sigma-70 factor, ECF subfamily
MVLLQYAWGADLLLGRTYQAWVTVDNGARRASSLPEVTSAGSHPGELELVAALRQRDESAFLALVRRFHPSMVRVARVFVNSEAIAEEVVQESWLAVLEGINAFEGRASLRSWMFSIVANRARTRAQREARSEPFSSFEDPEGEPTVDPARFHPPDHPRWPGHWSSPPERWAEEQLLLQETVDLTKRAIEELPPAQRQVIVLRDVEGCSAEEVCEALGVSDGNQRVLLHRARAKVRAMLEPHLRRAP